ncbi:MAG: hypothetical protein ACYTHJ_20265 [Planctomycetota bacterium]|jgi:hypothetical protein
MRVLSIVVFSLFSFSSALAQSTISGQITAVDGDYYVFTPEWAVLAPYLPVVYPDTFCNSNICDPTVAGVQPLRDLRGVIQVAYSVIETSRIGC